VRENDPLIWYYSGSLRNPVTGNEIAGIEGLEFIKLLPQRDNNMSRPDPDTCSYICKKIFVYTPPNNHSEVLTSYRVKPIAPKRKISRSSKEYHQIIHITPKPTSIEPASFTSDAYQRDLATKKSSDVYQIKVEWPGGRISSSNKIKITTVEPSPENKRFEVTNFISGGYKDISHGEYLIHKNINMFCGLS
jgi:hypothetical protein